MLVCDDHDSEEDVDVVLGHLFCVGEFLEKRWLDIGFVLEFGLVKTGINMLFLMKDK